MIRSMTGFGGKEGKVALFGKAGVELRSANHKFLDMVLHLPEGFLPLEDKVKKEIEARVKRGRLTCVVNITGGQPPSVFINKPLLKRYLSVLKNIKEEFRVKDEVRLETLIHLPGVLSLREERVLWERIWPGLKMLVNQALDNLVKARQKEGGALYIYLKNRTLAISRYLSVVKTRFKKDIKQKLGKLRTDEERASFLKETDIAEEIERLTFHIRNFKNKLSKNGPVGKELDFIAQEMQRETNTIGAKACNAAVSVRVVQIKSQIEKIREQVQNIE